MFANPVLTPASEREITPEPPPEAPEGEASTAASWFPGEIKLHSAEHAMDPRVNKLRVKLFTLNVRPFIPLPDRYIFPFTVEHDSGVCLLKNHKAD